jgi:hypothetical protein
MLTATKLREELERITKTLSETSHPMPNPQLSADVARPREQIG